MDTTNPNTQEQGVCPRCGGAMRERHYAALSDQPRCGDCTQKIRQQKTRLYSTKRYENLLPKGTK